MCSYKGEGKVVPVLN